MSALSPRPSAYTASICDPPCLPLTYGEQSAGVSARRSVCPVVFLRGIDINVINDSLLSLSLSLSLSNVPYPSITNTSPARGQKARFRSCIRHLTHSPSRRIGAKTRSDRLLSRSLFYVSFIHERILIAKIE